MSVYTNDVDTLHAHEPGVPQVANSAVTLAATAVSMLILNMHLCPYLPLLWLACVVLFATKCLLRQNLPPILEKQQNSWRVDGYIEREMIRTDPEEWSRYYFVMRNRPKEFEVLNEGFQDNADRGLTGTPTSSCHSMPISRQSGLMFCAQWREGILALNAA